MQTLVLFLGGLFVSLPLFSAVISVTSSLDSGAGSLRSAIDQANTNGDSSNTIEIQAGLSTIFLNSPLPMVNKDLTIEVLGGGEQVIDGSNAVRPFFWKNGSGTLSNIRIENAQAKGGDGGTAEEPGGGGLGAGGALFVYEGATVNLVDLTFNQCSALGGNAGNLSGFSGSGGGGGLGGDGGASTGFGGNGGGGFWGNGGSAPTSGDANGGGGGGGSFFDGANTARTNPGGGGGGGGDIAAGSPNSSANGGNGGGQTGGGGGGGGKVVSTGGNGGGDPSAQNGGGGTTTLGGAGGDGGTNPLTGAGGGGGGSGGAYFRASSNGGNGGFGGGGGGLGDGVTNTPIQKAGSGGFGGGGGSVGYQGNAGDGGFGGGGGGAQINSGGQGGFGGGGGAGMGAAGSGGFAGGNGADGAGGGGALGGTLFIHSGGHAIVTDPTFSGSSATAGIGSPGTSATDGLSFGQDLFMMVGGEITFNITTGTFQMPSALESDQGAGGGNGGGLVKTGAGTLDFSLVGTQSYQTSTTVEGGLIRLSQEDNLGPATNTLHLNGGGLNPTSSFTLTPMPINIGPNSGIIQVDSGASFTTNGIISGDGELVKNGLGTLTLAATNTYTGGTTVSDGVLSGTTQTIQGNVVNNSSVIFTQTSDGTYSGAMSGTGSLEKQGAAKLTLSGVNTYSGGTTVTAGTLEGTTNSVQGNITSSGAVIFDQGTDGTYSGILSGTGSLEKLGSGKVSLSGSNTHTGGTTVTAGTLEGSTSSLPGDITNNSALIFNQSVDGTYAGVISGSGSLEKLGAGKVSLTGSNTYSGGTTVTSGTLEGDTTSLPGNITNNSALAFNQSTDGTFAGVISGTGSLEKLGIGKLSLTGSNTYTGGTTVTAGTLQGSASSLVGNITNNSALVFDQTSDGTYLGVISGTGSLEKQGAAKLTLSGANTYSGGTTVTAGTLEGTTQSIQGNITNNSSLIFNQGTDGTYSGILSGMGSLEKLGSGKVSLSGSNTHTGGTTVTAGTLEGSISSLPGDITNNSALIFNQSVDGTFAGVISGSGSLEKLGSGTVSLTGSNTYSGSTTVTSGTLEGDTTSLPGNITNNSALAFNQSTDGTFPGVISGTGSLEKLGIGKLSLTGSNTYTGGTTVTAGTLEGTTQSVQGNIVNNSSVIFTQTSDGTYSGAMSGTGSLEKQGAAKLTLNGVNTYSGGTTVTAGTLEGTTDSVQGNIISSGAVIFSQATNGTYSGILSGAGSLEKLGSGKVSLSGSNTHTGGTTVTAGTLEGSTSSLPGDITNNSALIFNQSVDGTFAGVISGSGSLEKLGSGKVSLTGSNTYSGGTTVTSGTLEGDTTSLPGNITNNSALAFNQSSDGTFAGVIGGTGSLEKLGSSTLSLTGNNSYSGGTTISEGTLAVSASNLTGDVLNNECLTFNQVIDGDFAGAISGTGSVKKLGAGILTLSGNNTYSGGTLVTEGSLKGSATELQGNITNNTHVIFDQSVDGTFAGVMSGTGGLEKSGVGKLSLTGANTYTGGTTVMGGTLEGSASSLPGDVLNNSTLVINQTVDGTFSGIISGSGHLEKVGGGALTLSGANTYSGGSTVGDGTLIGTTVSLQGDILNNSHLIFDQGVDGTYTGEISGAGSVDKRGSGKLTLTGAQSYLGDTTVTGGTLEGNAATFSDHLIVDTHVIFNQSNDAAYGGAISGFGQLEKKGPAELVLTGVSSHTGGTLVSEGTLRGTTTTLQGDIANEGVLIFDQEFEGMYTGVITGSGRVEKQGNNLLILTNTSNISDAIDIQEGEIQAFGKAGGITSILANGALSGNGQFVDVVNSGRVIPGASIGQQIITGDYTQLPSGLLEIELNDQGESDQLIVSQTAFLDGQISILPDPGVYSTGDSYTIITANNVVGTFSETIQAPEFDFSVVYTPTTVLLSILSDGIVFPVPLDTLSGNAKAVADYLFCPEVTLTGDIRDVVELLVLNPAHLFADELNQLSPAQFGAFPLVNYENQLRALKAFNESVKAHFLHRITRDNYGFEEATFWLEPIGGYYHQNNGVEDQLGFRNHTYGVLTGTNHRFQTDYLLGWEVGYAHSSLHWSESAGDAQINTLFLGPQFALIKNNAYVNIAAIGAHDWVGVDRRIHFPGLDRTATNHHTAWEIASSIDAGFLIPMPNSFSSHAYLSPRFRFDYINIFESSYRESGAKSLNLAVDSKTTSFVGTEAIMDIFKVIERPNLSVVPKLNIGWEYRANVSGSHYTAKFFKQSLCKPNFSAVTTEKNGSFLLLGSECQLFRDNFEVGLSYLAKIASFQTIQNFDASLRWNF